ncbi:MAG: hypothetical protein OEM41_08800, partial [Ignavibacteria bacterium]|nr:hypothetical protein [Ignavibacteria bacterium]
MKRHHLLRAWLGPVVLAVVAGVLATAPGAGQSAQAPEHRGDVYVIERPEALIILNTYQQQLTAAERRTFEAFVPMVIVNEHTYLSDGFTPCMMVVIDGKTLFIQRDRSGDIVGLQRAGFHRAYRSVFLLSDSIRIVGPAMRLASIDRSASYALERGEILQRSFRQGDRTFVRRWSKTPPYGWVSLSDRDRSWEVVSRGPVATAMSTKLVMKV